MKAFALLLLAGAAQAQSCLDSEGRYWFVEPCPPGTVRAVMPHVIPDTDLPPDDWLPGKPATEGSVVHFRHHHHRGGKHARGRLHLVHHGAAGPAGRPAKR